MPSALFLGSYPPRRCGIATFTRDLVRAYDAQSRTFSDVVAIDDAGAHYAYGPDVVARLQQNARDSYRQIADRINAHPADVLNVQHEYGLFGGAHGAWLLDLIADVRKPTIVTLHTVLENPPPDHRAVARELLARAFRVIVLSETARELLVERYDAGPSRVSVIHHGVPDVALEPSSETKEALGFGTRPILSTFGLLSSGKGLEYALAAVHEIAQRHPDVLYLIIGATHPNVVAAEGEAYRDSLRDRIRALGIGENVLMIDRYLSLQELLTYLRATDVYVTPYVNPEQVVSGTLAYALAAGKAIVSTPYAYARELLSDGRGLLAAFRDARSIAGAIGSLLDDPALRRACERRAHAFGRRMTWGSVAGQYADVFAAACGRREVRTLRVAETPMRGREPAAIA